MARPAFQSQKIENGHEWQRLRPLTEPVEPKKVKMILQQARDGELGDLHRLYERTFAVDDRLGGITSALKRAVSSKRTRISPARKEARDDEEREIARRYADYARVMTRDVKWRTMLKTFLSPYLKGVDVFEVMYEREDAPIDDINRWYKVTGVESVPTRRLQMMQGIYGDYGKLGILQLNGEIKPLTEYDDRKVFSLADEPARGKWDEAGAARRCLTWWIVKQFIIRWWPQFAETSGEPIRIARTSKQNLDDETERKIVEAMKKLGSNGWGIVPDDIALEVKEILQGSKTADDVYKGIMNAANQAYTIAILGQTDTTESSEGAYAKAKIQNQVRMDILLDISKLASNGVEKVIEAGLRVNEKQAFRPHLAPTFEVHIPTPTGMGKKAKAFDMLQDEMSVALPVTQIRDEFGIETPDPEEPVIADGRRFEDEQDYLEYMAEKREAGPMEAAQNEAMSGGDPSREESSGSDNPPENSDNSNNNSDETDGKDDS
jgi:phage gp29-like protein